MSNSLPRVLTATRLVFLLGLIACGGKDVIDIVYEDPVGGPAKVTVTPTDATMRVGDSLQMSATIVPADWVVGEVRWSTNANEIATVSESGVVYAHSAGTVGVRATFINPQWTAAHEDVVMVHVE